ncbi:MAG: hypothetical protein GW763_05785 [Paraglaciecola sp.]|nr:hypothetical protein [Paraglaciecola sp.]NCT47492.1 hypothetical protein [Paraglaciecola sp.]
MLMLLNHVKALRHVAFCLLFLVAGVASAHQQKAAISTVLFNPRTQNIEIAHRFDIHDAEHAVKEIFGKDADILDSALTQQQFGDYVQQRFFLYTSGKEKLDLKLVGHEIEGKFFWVYQETAVPTTLQNMVVRNDALRDIWPLQVNTINIEGRGELQTLTFSDSVTLLEVNFGAAK